ncbi:uncharacterized protein LOC114420611 [Glycine soja]|uniref:uncharacterized protein n=1 Tax=Glycine max TaxID=3847 RepID=UPI0003DE7F21|nr:uncharacterized protein LOC102667961 [Glycine max]XP_028242264.1 uncharacterized protein LOC114420611 [Glycine soja]|eukprot:XP_006584367.1 uncharacterized protein LOC102667961 [Glycine max]
MAKSDRKNGQEGNKLQTDSMALKCKNKIPGNGAKNLLALSIMARPPNNIKSINGSKEALKLVVRINDLWFIGTPNRSEQAEMVIIDSHGDTIHVVCKQDQLKSWKADLIENYTYVMHNFKVMKNDDQFRICDHQYKLVFTGVTVLRQSNLEDLPFKKYQFADFTNIVAGLFEPKLLVDIIGVVDEVVYRHVGSENTRVVFKLKDLSGQILSCTLWDSYCLQFIDYLNQSENDLPIIIILMHSGPVSFTAGDQGSSQVSGSSQLSSKDAFLSKAEAKTIFDINNISKEIVCVTVDTINRIVMDNHSQCYPAYSYCYRKTDIETIAFTCACSKHNDQVVLRYRVEVMVTYKEQSTKFFMWDRECIELIGQSANEFNKLKIEEGDIDLNVSPLALDKLLGYVLAFKIKVQPKFNNNVVLRYSNDLDLINVVVDILPDAEQSMSGTADHDPLLGLPLTPTKRLPFDDYDDEPKASQISPA